MTSMTIIAIVLFAAFYGTIASVFGFWAALATLITFNVIAFGFHCVAVAQRKAAARVLAREGERIINPKG